MLHLLIWLGVVGAAVAAPPRPDLGLSMAGPASLAGVNQLVIWRLNVTNAGTASAVGVVVTNWLPPAATLFSATTSQGTITTNTGYLVFSLGTLAAGSGMTAQITVFSASPGTLTNRAWAATSTTESQTANTGATNSVSVFSSTFQSVGSMNLPRKWHTATLLNNGKVLITGGSTTNGLTDTAELFDPATGTFTLIGSMLHPRHQHSATLLNDGRVLIVGAVFITEPEIYDPATGTFSSAGTLNVSRWNHAASRLPDGRVLVTGGYADEGSAEVFDPATTNWTLVGRMDFSRVYHASIPLPDGRTLLAGGYDAGANADMFSPVTNGFTPAGTFLKQRSFATILRLANNLVLLAGGNDVLMMFDADLYTPQTQSSVSAGQMTTSRFECPGVGLPDGRALLAGGTGYLGIVTPTAEYFDAAAVSFSPAPSLNQARTGHTATMLPDGRVLVAGGYQDWPQGSTILASAEVLNPANTVPPPSVSVADAVWPEGNAGTNLVNFNLTLSSPLAVPVSVAYEVTAGSATSWNDFNPVSGTVVFSPGTTNQTVTVAVLGDTVYETDETVFLNLSSPTNAVIARRTATGTILNDDPLPVLSVPNYSVTEADRFATNVTVSVQLSGLSTLPVRCTFSTADVTATAGLDYVATNVAFVFQPGQTNLSITLSVLGDTLVESNEVVQFTLTQVTNALVGSVGSLTIVDNAGIAGKIHHFVFDPVPATLYLNDYITPFIYARDYQDNGSSFSGALYLDITNSGLTNYHWDFEDGTLNGWTPLYPGYGDGPYEVKTFDTGGEMVNGVVGFPSLAFRTRPNYGPVDGLTRTAYLMGGVTYNISYSLAESNEGPNSEYAGIQTQFYVNGTNVGGAGWSQYDYLVAGWVLRTKMSGTYTPPTNGVYTLKLTTYREAWEGYLYAYIDDIRIEAPRVTPLKQLMWVGLSVPQPIIRVQDLATNVMFRIYDLDGHYGCSTPFNVLPSADVYPVTAVNPVGSGVNSYENVTLVTEVHNAGPSPATGVLVTNILPAQFQFVSASAGGAPVSNAGNTVSCTFSNLAPNAVGYLTILARTTGEGVCTNVATVAANEHDPVSDNNLRTTLIQVQPPEVQASGGTVTETPGGTNAIFTVWLSSSNDVPVTVDFATADLTAVSNLDYLPVAGTVTFAPGVTNQTIAVAVLDDFLNESNETFAVPLTNPFHAMVVGGNAVATIIDDDLPPTLLLSDAAVVEGDGGLTNLAFAITLSAPSGKPVSFSFATANGTAVAGSDYVATNGSLSFPPGQTNATVSVSVIGDRINEPDETFVLRLTNIVNATAVNTQAVATILNDDTVPGRFDHFTFDPILPLRAAKVPFNLTIRAVDYLGNLVTNPPAAAQLLATNSPNPGLAVVIPSALSNFLSGVWVGAVTLSNVVTNVTLQVQDGAGHVGFSSPFNVVAYYPVSVLLPDAATEGDGPFTVSGAVTCTVTNDVDAWFALTVNNSDLLAVPGTVMLPAGQTNVPFDMKFWDDALLNGTRTASVTATPNTAGYATNTAAMKVYDNEFAILTVTLPASAPEKSAPLAGTVTLSAPPDTNIVITLTSSDTTELTVPASVTLPAGQTSVGFTANAVDDNLLDGTQYATVTAHVQNWQDGTATVALLDNETNKFTISYWFQGPFTEGMGTLTNALRLTVGGVLVSNLAVNLASSDPTELTVPATVTMGAGSNNILFNITIVDDAETDGTQPVTVTASLPDFTSGSLTLSVGDNDLHHFAFSTIGSTQTSGVPFSVSVTAKDVNNVTLTGYTNPPVFTAYGSSGPLSLTTNGFTGTGIVRGTFTGTVAVSAPVPQTVTLRAADVFGHASLSNPFQLGYPVWAGTPQITQLTVLGSDVRISFTSVATAQYFLQTATSLPPVWTSVDSGLMGNGSVMTLTNPAPTASGSSFFRLLVQPTP